MKRLTTIIMIGVAAGAAAACSSGDGYVPTEQGRQPLAIAVAAVTTGAVAERLEAGGAIAALETAALSSRIVATIAGVHVKAGDRVRKGDVLVTLDARDAVGHAQQARAGSVVAEKGLTRTRSEHGAAAAEHQLATAWRDRIAALHARNSATDHELDEASARLAAATARLAAAEAAIELADASLQAARSASAAASAAESYATLRAPFDGLVIERLTDPGNLAAPGVPLVRIESDGSRQAVVRVDERRAAYLRPGDSVDVEIDAAAGGDDEGTRRGSVAEVARATGEDQRSFTVKVALPGSVDARSGTFARVIFSGRSRQAVFVPESAVRRSGQVSSVFVADAGVARVRLVQPGYASPHGVEILAGLDAGELVVTSPPPGLVDGARVTSGAATTGAAR